METTSKPVSYFPKRRYGTMSKQTAEQGPIKLVSSVDDNQSVASTPPLQSETQTQVANRIFQRRAEKIADAHVTIRAGENEWEPNYRIEVPDLWSEAFDKVVKLRGDLYRKYPKAIINIEFRPKRELAEAENDPRFANL